TLGARDAGASVGRPHVHPRGGPGAGLPPRPPPGVEAVRGEVVRDRRSHQAVKLDRLGPPLAGELEADDLVVLRLHPDLHAPFRPARRTRLLTSSQLMLVKKASMYLPRSDGL